MKENSNQPQVAMTIEVLAVAAVETVIDAVAVAVAEAEVEIVEETAVLVVR